MKPQTPSDYIDSIEREMKSLERWKTERAELLDERNHLHMLIGILTTAIIGLLIVILILVV